MKKYNLSGLLALSLLCILTATLSAQRPKGALSKVQAVELTMSPTPFEYSGIVLSDPSIYADEPFSIILTVKNAGTKDAKQEVELMVKDEAAPKGQRKQAATLLSLAAGQSETVTFTFQRKDLLKQGEEPPEMFVFYLGDFELGIAYEAK